MSVFVSPLATGLPRPVTEVTCPYTCFVLGQAGSMTWNAVWGRICWIVFENGFLLIKVITRKIFICFSWTLACVDVKGTDLVIFYCEGSQLEDKTEMPARLESKDRRDPGSQWHHQAPAGLALSLWCPRLPITQDNTVSSTVENS